MPALLNRYATPLITGLFLISLVSGVALFLHWGSAWFHGMHEWLSLALILPFGLHLWKNWRPVTAYLKHPPLWIALAGSLVLALAFALPAATGGAGAGGRPPHFAFAERMMSGTLPELAAVLDREPAALAADLAAAGYASSPDQTLAEIAAAQGRTSGEVMALLLSTGR
ncbi:DUF4405 domain-containing protein [Pararhodobacter sp.]|uniref:DUF4405 domain-containing protein n=1 Tax=Pararhodobacter sp. TaxID=2127056 RepID=UPI002FE3062E